MCCTIVGLYQFALLGCREVCAALSRDIVALLVWLRKVFDQLEVVFTQSW